ncbi:MAG: hypothetical protein ACLBM1_05005 [Cuspidothrix sp.]|jgi:hypothetical protein|uniref:Uncharacterized protein n=1 Tax=Cuspidothrix issatschenkoi CHARLIE-1 TaxID=2052836 RepID=A0A2S6CVI5_9CYAN|nr:hypothetical protein [Cuspidothrix issatschenkoi]PPJ63746.1 hypothetical protein CUN59_08470 [Cuspidothrix issatschenkoi CHARLIE-1]
MVRLLFVGLIVVYIGGMWKFWNGFRRTNFNQTLPNRIILTLLWPALFLVNPSYRRNFQKALKGS